VLAWATAAGVSALIGLLQYFGATAAFGVWLNHTDAGTVYGNLRGWSRGGVVGLRHDAHDAILCQRCAGQGGLGPAGL